MKFPKKAIDRFNIKVNNNITRKTCKKVGVVPIFHGSIKRGELQMKGTFIHCSNKPAKSWGLPFVITVTVKLKLMTIL